MRKSSFHDLKKNWLNVTTLTITSGLIKGVKLKSPANSRTHPMGSREKMALFNMLQPHLENAAVLDLYAGSGALGFEALSRGARTVEFVENYPAAIAAIKQNLQIVSAALAKNSALDRVNDGTNLVLREVDVAKYLQDQTAVSTFDVIIADPPYDDFQVEALAHVAQRLQINGTFAISYPAKKFPEAPVIPHLRLLKFRQYAAAGIGLYQAVEVRV